MADILPEISIRLIRITIPVIIIVSMVGNTLNIAVLGRYKMRKHACCFYFIALSTNNLIYSCTILVISLLVDGYQIGLTTFPLVFCKLVTYFGTLLSALSPSFIILASIDRWCSSSSNVERRKFSNIRTAKYLILVITIFFSLLFIISFAMASVNTKDAVVCRIRGHGIFVDAYNIFIFILFSCLIPSLMLAFGCMTIFNVQRHRRIATISSYFHRTESQLFRMLLLQVGVQLLLILPICAFGLLLAFPSIYKPTSSFTAMFFICRVIFHVSYTTPFFLYILSSRTYRNEFTALLKKISLCYRENRTHHLRLMRTISRRHESRL